MKILMVLTSHDRLGNTGRPTGFWLEEFAAPYFVFRDAGVELTLASPQGGQPPVDPKSDLPESQTPAMARFKKDAAAQEALANTVKLADVKAEDFDAVFYPGGHGPMWDLAESRTSIALLEAFYNSGKPIALVCHAPGVLRHVTYQGVPLLKGKHVTGFTNGEEEGVQLTTVVPFLVEDELLRLGAIYEKVANWRPLSVTDGRLITGQNPASSVPAAQALLKLMTAAESEPSIENVHIGRLREAHMAARFTEVELRRCHVRAQRCVPRQSGSRQHRDPQLPMAARARLRRVEVRRSGRAPGDKSGHHGTHHHPRGRCQRCATSRSEFLCEQILGKVFAPEHHRRYRAQPATGGAEGIWRRRPRGRGLLIG
jgi:putative intracellular protease/amidase